MLGKIIATIHLCLAIFTAFYIFIIPKNFFYDFCFTIFNTVTQISWLLLNHECILSYVYKQTHYPNYYMGKTTDLDDFDEIVPGDNIISKIGLFIITVFNLVSIYVAPVRSKIVSPITSFIFLVLTRYFYIFYNSHFGFRMDHIAPAAIGKHNYKQLENIYYENKLHIYKKVFNETLLTILIIFVTYVFYKNRNRL